MNLIGAINGLLSGVLAFAGLQLFIEFMAEMRRPRDFLKGMFVAQAVIYTVYVVYGSFMYYYQGQYTFNPAYLGVSNYAWQTAGSFSPPYPHSSRLIDLHRQHTYPFEWPNCSSAIRKYRHQSLLQ